MRSIQFRGKSLKTGKWVFGYYAHRRIKTTGLYTPNHCIFIPDINYGTDGGYWEEIDPSTLGQKTGVQDIHLNAIYEGDVLKVYRKEYYVDGSCKYVPMPRKYMVYWSDDCQAFRIKDEEGFCQDFEFNYEQYEVVGDIYDERYKDDWE